MPCLLLLLCFFASQPTYAQTYFSRKKVHADIDAYHKTLFEVHYNPYQYISKKEYHKRVEAIKRSMPDSIDIKVFIDKIFQLTALLDDGHTGPRYRQSILADEWAKKIFLPISLLSDEKNSVFVQSGAWVGYVPTGSRLVSINNINVTKFVNERMAYVGGLSAYRKKMIVELLAYHLYLKGVRPPFHIKYLYNEKMHEAVVSEGIDLLAAFSLGTSSLKKTSYSFSVLQNKIGFIDLQLMSGDLGEYGHFLDSCFQVLRQKQIQTIAIDIRNNPGGNSLFGELLLSYLTKKPFLMAGKKLWKVSHQYQDHLTTRGDTANLYLKQEVGSIWELADCQPKKNFKPDSIYTGKVYLLTGTSTFSSANLMADAAKQFGLATLVGEPTGERTNDLGEVLRFVLPNSKIEINTSTAFFIGADCNKKVHKPVIPHITIITTAKDKLAGKDPVLAYVLNQAL